MTRILLVDDDVLVCNLMHDMLEDAGHEVCMTYDAKEARAVLDKDQNFHMCISDVDMPGENGISFLTYAKTVLPRAAFLLTSGRSQDNKGDFELITKPFHARDLIQEVRRLMPPALAA